MIKETVTYKDLDENDITEDFYFHLSGLELADLQLSVEGGLAQKIEQIAGTQDMAAVLKVFQQLVSVSVGRRSVDNKYFEKTPEITRAFMQSNAFEALFWKLVKEPKKLAEFIVGMVPAELRENATARMDEALAKVELPSGDVVEVKADSVVPRDIKDYTKKELEEMPYDDFASLMKRTNPIGLPQDILVVAMQRAMQNPVR